MARYRIDRIAELARELPFTPQETRSTQVDAAERLLHEIDPGKSYPLEFIVFRITGYHPRTLNSELPTGSALQHDLGLLIEQVSRSLDLRADRLSEPVLSIEQVSERFDVTSKTIQRWRRRGLPARRFLFPDGKRRVGFLIGSVERFFAAHREQVARGTNFSQVDDAERQDILRRARRLAGQCGCCRNEIARRIARRINRSPMTVLHLIRKHDQENPLDPIFPAGEADSISEAERQRIVRQYRHGVSLAVLARKSCRTRTAVYRVILDERLERIGRRKVKFIDDPLYHQADAEAVIAEICSQEPLTAESGSEDSRVPRDLPPYLQELYRTPLLSAAQERALFLKFNFHKRQFVQARHRLEPEFARLRDLDRIEEHLRAATATRNAILRANLRLVVSVARRHLRPGLSLMELVSDGNLTLMRAADGFDIHRGNKFSTYATLALMKGFARSVSQMLGDRARPIDEQALESFPDRDVRRAGDRLADREHVRLLLSGLTDRERDVLAAEYGLHCEDQIQSGDRTKLSTRRIRQIERTALAKLRRAAGRPASSHF